VEQALEQQIFDVPAALSAQNPLAQSEAPEQATPGSLFPPQLVLSAQAAEFGQGLLVAAQVCVMLEQALVVRVDPAHELAAQVVPPAV
jgi:hypothetical protein